MKINVITRLRGLFSSNYEQQLFSRIDVVYTMALSVSAYANLQ